MLNFIAVSIKLFFVLKFSLNIKQWILSTRKSNDSTANSGSSISSLQASIISTLITNKMINSFNTLWSCNDNAGFETKAVDGGDKSQECVNISLKTIGNWWRCHWMHTTFPMSSWPAWMTKPLPMMLLIPLRLTMVSMMLMLATPLLSATMFPRSPTCLVSSSGAPCFNYTGNDFIV